MFTNEKLIMNLLLVFILTIFLGILIYLAIKVYYYYKNNDKIKNQDETLLLDNWINGDSFPIITDKVLPSSLVGNEFSLTFLVNLNNLIPASKKYDQVLFERTTGEDYDLRVEIPKLINNPTSDLRFIFKLQSEVYVTEENEMLFPSKLEKKSITNEEIHNDLNTNKVNYTNNYDNNTYNNIENKIFVVGSNREKTIDINSKGNSNSNNSNVNSNNNHNKNIKTEYDYIELNNNTTHKVFHVGLVVYNNIVDIYKNGELVSSKVLTGLPSINHKSFTFFKESNFNGSLNKVTYFNKALNHFDIKNNYMKYSKQMKDGSIINIKI